MNPCIFKKETKKKVFEFFSGILETRGEPVYYETIRGYVSEATNDVKLYVRTKCDGDNLRKYFKKRSNYFDVNKLDEITLKSKKHYSHQRVEKANKASEKKKRIGKLEALDAMHCKSTKNQSAKNERLSRTMVKLSENSNPDYKYDVSNSFKEEAIEYFKKLIEDEHSICYHDIHIENLPKPVAQHLKQSYTKDKVLMFFLDNFKYFSIVDDDFVELTDSLPLSATSSDSVNDKYEDEDNDQTLSEISLEAVSGCQEDFECLVDASDGYSDNTLEEITHREGNSSFYHPRFPKGKKHKKSASETELQAVKYFADVIKNKENAQVLCEKLRGHISQAPKNVCTYVNSKFRGQKFNKFLQCYPEIFKVKSTGNVVLSKDFQTHLDFIMNTMLQSNSSFANENPYLENENIIQNIPTPSCVPNDQQLKRLQDSDIIGDNSFLKVRSSPEQSEVSQQQMLILSNKSEKMFSLNNDNRNNDFDNKCTEQQKLVSSNTTMVKKVSSKLKNFQLMQGITESELLYFNDEQLRLIWTTELLCFQLYEKRKLLEYDMEKKAVEYFANELQYAVGKSMQYRHLQGKLGQASHDISSYMSCRYSGEKLRNFFVKHNKFSVGNSGYVTLVTSRDHCSDQKENKHCSIMNDDKTKMNINSEQLYFDDEFVDLYLLICETLNEFITVLERKGCVPLNRLAGYFSQLKADQRSFLKSFNGCSISDKIRDYIHYFDTLITISETDSVSAHNEAILFLKALMNNLFLGITTTLITQGHTSICDLVDILKLKFPKIAANFLTNIDNKNLSQFLMKHDKYFVLRGKTVDLVKHKSVNIETRKELRSLIKSELRNRADHILTYFELLAVIINFKLLFQSLMSERPVILLLILKQEETLICKNGEVSLDCTSETVTCRWHGNHSDSDAEDTVVKNKSLLNSENDQAPISEENIFYAQQENNNVSTETTTEMGSINVLNECKYNVEDPFAKQQEQTTRFLFENVIFSSEFHPKIQTTRDFILSSSLSGISSKATHSFSDEKHMEACQMKNSLMDNATKICLESTSDEKCVLVKSENKLLHFDEYGTNIYKDSIMDVPNAQFHISSISGTGDKGILVEKENTAVEKQIESSLASVLTEEKSASETAQENNFVLTAVANTEKSIGNKIPLLYVKESKTKSSPKCKPEELQNLLEKEDNLIERYFSEFFNFIEKSVIYYDNFSLLTCNMLDSAVLDKKQCSLVDETHLIAVNKASYTRHGDNFSPLLKDESEESCDEYLSEKYFSEFFYGIENPNEFSVDVYAAQGTNNTFEHEKNMIDSLFEVNHFKQNESSMHSVKSSMNSKSVINQEDDVIQSIKEKLNLQNKINDELRSHHCYLNAGKPSTTEMQKVSDMETEGIDVTDVQKQKSGYQLEECDILKTPQITEHLMQENAPILDEELRIVPKITEHSLFKTNDKSLKISNVGNQLRKNMNLCISEIEVLNSTSQKQSNSEKGFQCTKNCESGDEIFQKYSSENNDLEPGQPCGACSSSSAYFTDRIALYGYILILAEESGIIQIEYEETEQLVFFTKEVFHCEQKTDSSSCFKSLKLKEEVCCFVPQSEMSCKVWLACLVTAPSHYCKFKDAAIAPVNINYLVLKKGEDINSKFTNETIPKCAKTVTATSERVPEYKYGTCCVNNKLATEREIQLEVADILKDTMLYGFQTVHKNLQQSDKTEKNSVLTEPHNSNHLDHLNSQAADNSNMLCHSTTQTTDVLFQTQQATVDVSCQTYSTGNILSMHIYHG